MLASEKNVKDITQISSFLAEMDRSSSNRHTPFLRPALDGLRILQERLQVEVDLRIQLQSLQMQGFDTSKHIYQTYSNYDASMVQLKEIVDNANKMIPMRAEFLSVQAKIPSVAKAKLEELFKDPTKYLELTRLWSKIRERIR